MPELFLPNGQQHRSTKRGNDFVTVHEAQAMLVSLYGPLASLVKEMAIKLQMDGVEPEQIDGPIAPASGDIE